MSIKRNPSPYPNATFSDAVTVSGQGRWIFVSGHVGAGMDAKIVEGGPAKEAEQMFERLRLSLEHAGAGMENVVKITGWVVDFKTNYRFYNEARGRAFGSHLPASAAVETTYLSLDAKFEVDAIAFVPDEP
jgi:enamine deaminase RidA (YjgF/YER057c/UK114 family)